MAEGEQPLYLYIADRSTLTFAEIVLNQHPSLSIIIKTWPTSKFHFNFYFMPHHIHIYYYYAMHILMPEGHYGLRKDIRGRKISSKTGHCLALNTVHGLHGHVQGVRTVFVRNMGPTLNQFFWDGRSLLHD